MTSIIISMFTVCLLLFLMGCYVVHFACEAWKAWRERREANARYVCRVTGAAWERANGRG